MKVRLYKNGVKEKNAVKSVDKESKKFPMRRQNMRKKVKKRKERKYP